MSFPSYPQHHNSLNPASTRTKPQRERGREREREKGKERTVLRPTHLCLQFCQRCKRAEQKLITLKSFIKKVYFLLAQPSTFPVPFPSSLSSCPKKRATTKAKQKQTSNHKMSVVVYFGLVICRCYAYFYLFCQPIVSEK